jgi:hypothetical protein
MLAFAISYELLWLLKNLGSDETQNKYCNDMTVPCIRVILPASKSSNPILMNNGVANKKQMAKYILNDLSLKAFLMDCIMANLFQLSLHFTYSDRFCQFDLIL